MSGTNDGSQAISIILKASYFAAKKHRTQKRKDIRETPYINHPLEVSHVLSEAGITDPNILAAALLHDTLEDTDTTPEELEDAFGPVIRSLVEEVSDDKTLSSKVRKQQQVENAPTSSYGAQLIKLADKICNVRDIHNHPPKGWDRDRCTAYCRWSVRVIDGLRGVHAPLEARFDQICDQFFSTEPIPLKG